MTLELVQYCVYSHNPEFVNVIRWIQDNRIDHEVHLNRTRFWVRRTHRQHSDLCLRFYHCITRVVDE